MAPRKAATTAPEAQAQPQATAVANTAMKTVQGYTIQLLAFIPIDPKDLRTQAAIPTILMNIEEGSASINDLMPYLRQIEFRSQNTRKRVSADEHAALFAKPETHTPENTDIDSEGRTEDEREEPTVSEHDEEFVEQGDGDTTDGEGQSGDMFDPETGEIIEEE